MGKPFKYRESVQEYVVVKKTLKDGKDDTNNGSGKSATVSGSNTATTNK
jgi:hypothetical protein